MVEITGTQVKFQGETRQIATDLTFALGVLIDREDEAGCVDIDTLRVALLSMTIHALYCGVGNEPLPDVYEEISNLAERVHNEAKQLLADCEEMDDISTILGMLKRSIKEGEDD